MSKKEIVTKGLKHCTDSNGPECDKCPYYSDNISKNICMWDLLKDSAIVIREQGDIIEQYSKADSFLDAHGWKWT